MHILSGNVKRFVTPGIEHRDTLMTVIMILVYDVNQREYAKDLRYAVRERVPYFFYIFF